MTVTCAAALGYFREFFPAHEDSRIHNCLCFLAIVNSFTTVTIEQNAKFQVL